MWMLTESNDGILKNHLR